MNQQIYIFIALGIILIVFLIYYFLMKPSTGLIQFVDLNVSNTALVSNSLPVINSTNYTYCMWINANTWTNNQKYLIYRGGHTSGKYPPDTTSVAPKSVYDFLLRLDNTEPKLYCSFGPTTSNTLKEYTLTAHFPIQKWVCIAIVLDGMNLDFYMDGKLAYSTKMSYLPIASTNNINFGNPSNNNTYIKNDIFIANFNILNYPFDPNTAMSYYNSGSGQSSSMTSNYQANVSLLRNNTPYVSLPLF